MIGEESIVREGGVAVKEGWGGVGGDEGGDTGCERGGGAGHGVG